MLVLIGLTLAMASSGWAEETEPPDKVVIDQTGDGRGAEGEPSGLSSIQSISIASLGSAFTYQGRLTSGGSAVSGNCDFQFSLWDAVSGGTQIGATQTPTNVPVSNGLFTVQLDFGSGAFNGTARWLEIAVRCPAGSGSYTPLAPRQALTPAPYALALPGLWTQQNATSPNLIGGYFGNSVTSGVVGATIGGGGNSSFLNRVTDDYGTVGGGVANRAGNNAGTTSDRGGATVGGGFQNQASGTGATVGGGGNNTAGGQYATVGGGFYNTANDESATVGGGFDNDASGYVATVGGGRSNTASGQSATVGGGGYNTASGQYATVGGGSNNDAIGYGATIGGGGYNTASGQYATVGGGEYNTASGYAATVGGGSGNTAAGDYSFVVGRGAKNSDPNHDGVFLFADSTNANFLSTAANQFRVRATGGVQFWTNSALTTGCYILAGGGSWTCTSDRNVKENLTPADGRAILKTLSRLPLYTWNMKGGDPAVRHLGPMAQDFYAAFGLGSDDRTISTIDLDGVSLAAIQGLYEVVQEKEAQNAELRARVAQQQTQIDALEARLAALERQSGGGSASLSALPVPWSALGGLGLLGALAYWRGKRRGER
ncbi:tail fiber domain-containing protein [Roseiflexus sp.]|uniref:tail fiber domain-containing protein n=1 Tax=Roseiflexus sp. TaxID=2562120 RepID=UPI00398B599A